MFPAVIQLWLTFVFRLYSALGSARWLEALAGAHTSFISFVLRKHIQAKGFLETGQCQDTTDVPLVKAIGTPSKGDRGGQVPELPVEDFSGVGLPFRRCPYRRAATHFDGELGVCVIGQETTSRDTITSRSSVSREVKGPD